MLLVNLDGLDRAGYGDLQGFVYFLINFAMSFSVFIAVVAIVLSGFKFILSMGDEKKIAEASKSLLYALIGLILVFISPTIIQFIIKQILEVR
ncbi:MAG: hypothetical protein ACOX6Q_02805 [Candidatus Dojkabacteria bacterium]|jgi:hypothetical protein